MDYLKKIKNTSPLVHCLTNVVSVNDCANALLAIGARPVMAEHPAEAAKITSTAAALLINTGTLTDSKIAAMKISAAEIGKKPFVIDCVGAASSAVRYETVEELLEINVPRIIKGNVAEIAAVCTGKMTGCGVDAVKKSGIDAEALERFASSIGAVAAVTGEEDVITDGEKIVRVKNGSPMLAKVTGTGCMLGCIMAAMMTVTDAYNAAVYSASVMGICGEIAAYGSPGTGTFRVKLMDALSSVTDADILEKINVD